jgi:electron transfer flavoprotein alpha subunit
METLGNRIVVYIEIRDGKVLQPSLEVISEAVRFASRSRRQVAGVLIAENADDEMIAELLSDIGRYGIDKIYMAKGDRYNFYSQTVWVNTISFFIEKYQPKILLFAQTQKSMELLPAVAARLKLPIISGASFFRASGDSLQVTTSVFARQASSICDLPGDGTLIVGLLPRVFESSRSPKPLTPEVEEFEPSFTDDSEGGQITLLEAIPDDFRSMDLEDAEIIVSGGKGLKSSENFALLGELAEELGGTIGGSRIAVDNNWIDRNRMVGQTGKTVSPELYIACGISGATQHVMGIKSSRQILAINTDKEAPIFKVATVGVVGDLFKVVPEMIKKIKEEKQKAEENKT